MAGGKGLRLRPYTKNLPKPMLKISKKRIIYCEVFYSIKIEKELAGIPTSKLS